MRTSYILFVFVFISTIATTTLAWRSKSPSSESTGITIGGPKRIGGGAAAADKERHKQQQQLNAKKEEPNADAKNETQQFNIGLILPHTNFGKREYQRAIGYGLLNYILSYFTHSLLMDAFIQRRTQFMMKMYIKPTLRNNRVSPPAQ